MFQGKSPAMEKLRTQIERALEQPTHPADPSLESQEAADTIVSLTVQSGPISDGGLESEDDSAESVAANTFPGILKNGFAESELILGLIGAVGAELEKVRSALEDRLKAFGYTVTQVRITRDVIPLIVPNHCPQNTSEHARIAALMDAGNEARKKTNDNSVLALGAAAFINGQRQRDFEHEPRRVYIVSSLKHPDEVSRLREIYPEGFFLIGVHASEKRRFDYLTKDKNMSAASADALIRRDENENLPYGQKVNDAFHLSDFFVRIDGKDDCLKHSLWRILDIMFGHPYKTPTFDEYAMFMAFAASLRSADLSRQVGAVVTIDDQVVSTGANDCPKAGGGLYWPQRNHANCEVEDQEGGRDYMREWDSNRVEQQ
jgi:deoxycytidylate deaminase